MSVIGQEGLFNCPQLSPVTVSSRILGTRMKWTTTVEAVGQDDFAQLRETKKIKSIELSSQNAQAAEQF